MNIQNPTQSETPSQSETQSETPSQSSIHDTQQDMNQSSPVTAPEQETPTQSSQVQNETFSAQQQSPKTSEKQSSTNTTSQEQFHSSEEDESKTLIGKIAGYETDFIRQKCLVKMKKLKNKRELDEITYQFLVHAINFFGDTLIQQGTLFIQ